jgi:putative phosphoribosyl transferase
MFRNRREAGRLLGMELETYRTQNPIVLAIPRGGVEVGYEVATHLNCEFSVAIARKLGFLQQPEAAFGAIAEDGSLYFNPHARGRLTKEEIDAVMEKEKAEIARRVKTYRDAEPLISLENRVVIIVDDGIATGSTLFAVIEMCRKQNPEKIVVAAPVCGSDMLRTLLVKVDDVIILDVPEPFYAVSQVYDDFQGLSDSEVKRFMNKWKSHHKVAKSRNSNSHT